jgi:hypothetical protein
MVIIYDYINIIAVILEIRGRVGYARGLNVRTGT